MSFPKLVGILGIILFAVIGVIALFRGGEGEKTASAPLPVAPAVSKPVMETQKVQPIQPKKLPEADRMDEFFNIGLPKLPIVQTLTYSSKVSWLEGKPAWVADYAAHYKTSRHFIARSLNQARNYEKQEVMNGDHFNVFREDRPISFHLVVDTSRCRMWVYYLDETTQERTLVKTYPVGLGRPDEKRKSGFLTPLGTYKLGDKIAVYRPGVMGQYNKQPTEMISVFGTRWIPFSQEIGECTAPAKGLGLHGCPWITKEGVQTLQEDLSGLEGYDSDGCIRLRTEDMEELFSVIITSPTTVYLVKDFFEASLPGKEGI